KELSCLGSWLMVVVQGAVYEAVNELEDASTPLLSRTPVQSLMALRATSDNEKDTENLTEVRLRSDEGGGGERGPVPNLVDAPRVQSGQADVDEPPIGATKARETR